MEYLKPFLSKYFPHGIKAFEVHSYMFLDCFAFRELLHDLISSLRTSLLVLIPIFTLFIILRCKSSSFREMRMSSELLLRVVSSQEHLKL